MTNVIPFNGITKLDLNPELVIDGAKKADLESCVIMGYTKDGDEYFASSLSDGRDVNWLIDRMKLRLLQIEPDED